VLCYGLAPCEEPDTTVAMGSPVVSMASTPDGKGYWLATAGGGVRAYGDASRHGTAIADDLAAPVVTIARTPTGDGYWLLTAAGLVKSFGDAGSFGSWQPAHLTSPAVDLVPTLDGGGYWIVNTVGNVFAFGDAVNYGHPARAHPGGAVRGMAATIDGKGYWIVTADGHLYNYGDAASLHFSTRGRYFTQAVAGIAASPSGTGFWLVGENGQVQTYGKGTTWYGSNAAEKPVDPVAAIDPAPDGVGYWLLEPDAFTTNFTHPGSGGSLAHAIVNVAASQIEGDPDRGAFCNPYGPCEPWCALFATWVWRQAGVDIPEYAFVGAVYDWAAAYTAVVASDDLPAPGDEVLYGTGPQSVAASPHMGIVVQVWRDGFIDTVEGDAGPSADGHFNVVINGPYLARASLAYNGMPIYGYAVP
jgi:hypothetical protein